MTSSLRRLAPWALLFVVMNAVITPPTHFPGGAANALSRFATMRAMEHGAFRIDPYVEWVMDPETPHDVRGEDWARTPDGRYYSNKAPGSAFVGFPLFWLLDSGPIHAMTHFVGSPMAPPAPWVHRVLSALTQLLPFLLVTALALTLLPASAYTGAGFHFTALAILFGNTASVYMGCYFGHGMTAMFVLAAAVALMRRRYGWLGLCYGLALLTDYSVGMLLPGLVAALIVQNGRRITWLLPLALGGLLPGALWVWYHTACFGGPFAIANQFQNPMFQDTNDSATSLWGIFDISLRGDVFAQLLFGARRGVLFTQPWMLAVVAAAGGIIALARGDDRANRQALALFGLLGFGLLLVMNACFGAWHGGWCPGPRYMSAIFAALGLLAGFVYADARRPLRALLWIALAVAVQFHAQVYATHVLPARDEALWGWQWARILQFDYSYSALAKLTGFWVLAAGAGWWTSRKR